MNELTLCLPYYDNPEMLARQYMALADLPLDLKTGLRLIVVDDGSPRWPATPPAYDIGLPFALYRITVDIPWNQDAARNLAVTQARTPWVILTDIDHVVPAATLRRLIFGKLNPAKAYRFGLRLDAPNLTAKEKDGKPHPHPNSFVMRRELYDRVGGYDEALCGNYGTDGDFVRRLTDVAELDVLAVPLIRFSREVIADASTTTLERKRPEEKARIRELKGLRGPDWRPLRGTCPWVWVA